MKNLGEDEFWYVKWEVKSGDSGWLREITGDGGKWSGRKVWKALGELGKSAVEIKLLWKKWKK